MGGEGGGVEVLAGRKNMCPGGESIRGRRPPLLQTAPLYRYTARSRLPPQAAVAAAAALLK